MNRYVLAFAALVLAAGIALTTSTMASAGQKTEIEVEFSNFQWQAPGFFAPGENFWAEDVGNPDKPITKLELLYIEDLTDTETGGDIVDCVVYEHEWDTVVKNIGGFPTAHTIATRQKGHVECDELLGRSGEFEYTAAVHKNPSTGVGTIRTKITGSSGGLEGLTGSMIGEVGGTQTLTVQFSPN